MSKGNAKPIKKKVEKKPPETGNITALEPPAVTNSYQVPAKTFLLIFTILYKDCCITRTQAAKLTYWILRVLSEQKTSQDTKLLSITEVAAWAAGLIKESDEKYSEFEYKLPNGVKPSDITISKMLSPDFCLTPVENSDSEEADPEEHWENNELCWKYRFTPDEAQIASKSVYDAINRSLQSAFKGKTDSEKLEDQAIIEAFKKDDRTTPQRFENLADDLREIEKLGHILREPRKLFSSILNLLTKRNYAGIAYMEPLDKWLCKNWVRGDFLCRFTPVEIAKSWDNHQQLNGAAKLTATDLNATVRSRLHRLKLKRFVK